MEPARLALGIWVSMASCGACCGTSLAFLAREAASLLGLMLHHRLACCDGSAICSWPHRCLHAAVPLQWMRAFVFATCSAMAGLLERSSIPPWCIMLWSCAMLSRSDQHVSSAESCCQEAWMKSIVGRVSFLLLLKYSTSRGDCRCYQVACSFNAK